jgi:hypothetical protein
VADALNGLFVADENWRKLPADIVETIQRITGADGKKQIKKGHLDAEYPNRNQPLVYVVGYMEQVGTPVYGQHGQQVATLKVNSGDLFLQGDWKRSKSSPDKKGQLDPSTSVVNTDVIPFDSNTITVQKGSGDKTRKVIQKSAKKCAFFGPAYLWPDQYLTELPPEVRQKFYTEPDSTGRTLSDTYVIHLTSPPRKIEAISGIQVGADNALETVMAGERSDIQVRLGMGVEFRVESLGVPSLCVMSGVIVNIADGLLAVRCVLRASQLPHPGNAWQKMDASSAFETNLELRISPSDVIRVNICHPTAIWQFKEQTDDIHIMARTDIVVDTSVIVTQNTPANILQGLYGHGSLAGKVKLHLHRVSPLEPRVAFDIVARRLPNIFGTMHCTLGSYQDFIQRRFDEFVQEKPIMTNRATADNTMHLKSPDGWLFLRVLDEYLNMDSCQVALEDSVFAITAPKWEDAQRLLSPGQANGVFDLTAYGHGFVEIFAPIVFKWEIYDTTRERNNSRSVDGFVAITFSGYQERDRHNNPAGIKDTRQHPDTKRQMNRRPSACPGF